MIKSANQYPVHELLSFEGNLTYRVPPYQREYSWQKLQWEDLFQDLVETEDAHFLGTIITLNQTVDAVASGVLELIDGQQRATTITLLLAAIYSVLHQHRDDLDDEARNELFNLGRRLVGKGGALRVTPQKQGHNLDDYVAVLADAGLGVGPSTKRPYFSGASHRQVLPVLPRRAQQARREQRMRRGGGRPDRARCGPEGDPGQDRGGEPR